MTTFVHDTAEIAEDAALSPGTKVWHYAQVREQASVGANCVIGRGAYIGPGVQLGDNCKVQNYALVYEPARLGHGVFTGPGVVLTNDHFPRAINPDGSLKSLDDWAPVGVTILEGASIGGGSTCIAPVTIGRWALVGAGSVVVKDVPDFALVVGSPARRIGWVGPYGQPLDRNGDGLWVCPVTGTTFREAGPDQIVEQSTTAS